MERSCEGRGRVESSLLPRPDDDFITVLKRKTRWEGSTASLNKSTKLIDKSQINSTEINQTPTKRQGILNLRPPYRCSGDRRTRGRDRRGEGISSPRSAALGANHSRHSPAAQAQPSPFFQLPLPWRRPNARRRGLLEDMDFASRHTASAPPPAAGADASSSAAVTEEPEYLARYFVVKHSWRGR